MWTIKRSHLGEGEGGILGRWNEEVAFEMALKEDFKG